MQEWLTCCSATDAIKLFKPFVLFPAWLSLTVKVKSFRKKITCLSGEHHIFGSLYTFFMNTVYMGMTWCHLSNPVLSSLASYLNLLCPLFLCLTCMMFFDAFLISVFSKEQCSGFALNCAVLCISSHLCTVLRSTKNGSVMLQALNLLWYHSFVCSNGPFLSVSYPVVPISMVSILLCPFEVLFLTIHISPHYFYNHVLTVCMRIKWTTPDR